MAKKGRVRRHAKGLSKLSTGILTGLPGALVQHRERTYPIPERRTGVNVKIVKEKE